MSNVSFDAAAVDCQMRLALASGSFYSWCILIMAGAPSEKTAQHM